MTNQIPVKIPARKNFSYPIFMQSGLLKKSSLWLPRNVNTIIIITDNTVKKFHARSLMRDLKNKKNRKVLLISFPAGEKSKNDQTKQYIEKQMLRYHCRRDTLILALGGGVVGDLAGYVAATYMRGIDYLQLPTTLLAMVDSSIGGKTGINTPQGKNLIGAFWQPKAVVVDVNCLKTLSKKQLINGLIEALKIFLTNHANSFSYLQNNLEKILVRDEKILKNIIYRAVKIKANIVSQDEKENNQRMILNFGHTIGHALEKISNYNLLHGFAVAYGILLEAKIAQLLGFLANKNYMLIKSVLLKLGISGAGLKKFAVKKLIQATKLDKKVRTGKVRYVILSGIGQVHKNYNIVAHPVSDKLVKKAYLEVTTE